MRWEGANELRFSKDRLCSAIFDVFEEEDLSNKIAPCPVPSFEEILAMLLGMGMIVDCGSDEFAISQRGKVLFQMIRDKHEVCAITGSDMIEMWDDDMQRISDSDGTIPA